MEWPPHSPDLNPIEHVWNMLKKALINLFPELYLDGRSQIDWRKFRHALVAAWEAIPQRVIDNLILSMPNRIEALRKAKGWYTHY